MSAARLNNRPSTARRDRRERKHIVTAKQITSGEMSKEQRLRRWNRNHCWALFELGNAQATASP
jgi:hypothetical protein